MKIKTSLVVVCFFLTLLCHASENVTTIDHSITIFVHGTYLMRKFWQYSPCRPLMYCPQGLTLAKSLPEHYHFHKIAKGCVSCDQDTYSMDHFYIFGWESEYVNHGHRKKTAKVLVEQMYTIVNDYYLRFQVVPKIRLIGFSHGGNVILNIAHHIEQYVDFQDVEFEAWLFGTPVQKINHDLVNSNCFKSIYSIYSKKDIIQKIDPQGLINRKITKNHFWSDRTFAHDARCIQVDFTVNGDGIVHSFYNVLFQHFPKIKQLIEVSAMESESNMIAVDFKMQEERTIRK